MSDLARHVFSPLQCHSDKGFLSGSCCPSAASRHFRYPRTNPHTALACSSSSFDSVKYRRHSIRCAAPPSQIQDPQLSHFEEAAKGKNYIPVFRCVFDDHLTPILAYRCLVKEDDREAPSFLFESVEPGLNDSTIGRYSVVGAQPSMEIVAKESMVTILDHREGKKIELTKDDPMEEPRRIMAEWEPHDDENLPDCFCGGWVGYFSYDTVRYAEKKKLPFSDAPADDRNLPDIHLGLYENVVVIDHVEKKVFLIHWVNLDRYSDVKEGFYDGIKHLDDLQSRVQIENMPKLRQGSINLATRQFGPKLEESSMTREQYMQAVLQAKEHILAGDIFQIVLSQRFERRTFADPFETYRSLRIVNPSPYMAYLQARGCILVASSPEILTRVKNNTVINRPLAGTSRRGKTKREDLVLEDELLHDEKQCAEHIMLVDLGRNDVGKVSKSGSVKVEKLMNIERYSHVMHISSTVSGDLQDKLSSWDVLRAALPVGTVSGAPKVKAMELIDKLEVTRRGPYSGGFGGISFTGDMDIALALRTIVFPTNPRFDTMFSFKNSHRREWIAHLQAGAGIVADSNPADEQKECENKAACLARAIDLAESTLQLALAWEIMDSVKVYVVYYSLHGHVEIMAREILRGANEVAGVEATLWQIPETLSSLILQKMDVAPRPDDVPCIAPKQLEEADGFLFGFPSRFGMMPAQWKAFWDATDELFAAQSLAGKPAGIFWCTGFHGGGQELTALTTVTQLAHHGILFVPLGYAHGKGMRDMEQVVGGSSYGAGTFAADGSRKPTELELEIAFYQGKHVAEITKKLKRPPPAGGASTEVKLC